MVSFPQREQAADSTGAHVSVTSAELLCSVHEKGDPKTSSYMQEEMMSRCCPLEASRRLRALGALHDS